MPRGYLSDEPPKQPEPDAPEPFSLELVCGAHREQLAFCRDRAPWIHAMCARQSGKSQGDLFILLENALAVAKSTNIFLGLKGTGVKFSMWEPWWKPLCARFGVDEKCHNNTSMLTTFENGSRVVFAGTDDLSNARKYLGNSFPGGVFIIDEAQSQSDGMLKYLIENLLPPTLTDTSRVYMTGVLPDVPAGYFYDRACDKPLAEDSRQQQSKGFSHHEWGRASNIHTPGAMEWLANHKRKFNIADDDPQILRDWYMLRVWDPNAAAYRYDRARNGYVPDEPPWLYEARAKLSREGIGGTLVAAVPWRGIEIVSVALDPGGHDRTAIEVSGWGSTLPEVQHLFGWTTERHATAGWDAMGKVLGIAREFVVENRAAHWWYDSNSDNELDTFTATYGVPALKPADKKDLPGQVRMTNSILGSGTAKVIIGSKLEEDMQKARWDETAARDRRFEWASAWHPDPSEAFRYTLRPYFNIYRPPDKRTMYERMRDDEKERINALLEASRGGLGMNDQLSRILGMNEPSG
jgi:hypothetical protein